MKTLVFLFIILYSSFLLAKDGNHGNVANEQCDLIEMNYFYDDQERLVFIQFLFYDESLELDAYVLRAWRMSKHGSRNLGDGNVDERIRWENYVSKLNLPENIACQVAGPNNGRVPIWISNPMYPVKNYNTGFYSMTWQDGFELRKISSKQFRVTHTSYDPELTNREILPKEKRRELMSSQKRIKK